jgi:hypothetical protein
MTLVRLTRVIFLGEGRLPETITGQRMLRHRSAEAMGAQSLLASHLAPTLLAHSSIAGEVDRIPATVSSTPPSRNIQMSTTLFLIAGELAVASINPYVAAA